MKKLFGLLIGLFASLTPKKALAWGVAILTAGVIVAALEIDYMEYATDGAAQGAYVTSATGGDLATGGTITTDSGYVIHTFTSNGTFTPLAAFNVEYLVVAGGAGGGQNFGAGGGAGGYRTNGAYDHAVTAQGYSITVGAGGAGSSTEPSAGTSGGNSIFDTITSAGGGGGASYGGSGVAGGSGGGGTIAGGAAFSAGAAGDTPDTTPDQGYAGGSGGYVDATNRGSGGGGGAGSVGAAFATLQSGNGGSGTASSISGASVTYAGGGGGGGYTSWTVAAGTASGGGGAGAYTDAAAGTAGTANTGGGGGGGAGASGVGGAGGSGIVIIRYPMQLQSYSESTIKTEGSYALKLSATTDALNETVTKTLTGGDILDLTGKNTIKLDARSTGTGSNLEFNIHDSGGTTTTHTINISSADTYQTDSWDISGVSDADKNAIDQLQFKVLNAGSARDFYIDNVYGQ